MKIKQPSRKHLERSRLRKLRSHYWLEPQAPKKMGRLAQLNKRNHHQPSEFVLMAERIDNEYGSRS